MNRSQYFNYIDEKLNALAYRIGTRGRLNLLDLHLHSENFYLHFFNLLFGYQLENLNSRLQNVEAIDLIDRVNKIIIQVSATCIKQKVESTLSKEILKDYAGYSFKFISISKDATELRKSTFKNPYSLLFSPSTDIYDIATILNVVLSRTAKEQKIIYEFIKDELGGDVDITKLDSNLASVINILSKERWDDISNSDFINSFEVYRKITFNELDRSRSIIEEYRVYYKKVDEKYSEFDQQGVNKSYSVLRSISKEYIRLKGKENPDEIFDAVIERTKNKVLESANFNEIPIDELELCVDILVVDAFIRCKIFENPEQYNYVAPR
jgi:hypothetical protein